MTINNFLVILADVILNPLIRLMFAVALVVFLWGVFEYVKNSDSDEGRNKGKQHIVWGLVGLFIMISVDTILKIALNTFDITI